MFFIANNNIRSVILEIKNDICKIVKILPILNLTPVILETFGAESFVWT